MSECSLDSLETPSSSCAEVPTSLEDDCCQRSDILEVSVEREVNDPFHSHGTTYKSAKDAGFNERTVTRIPIRYQHPEKSRGNAIIASGHFTAVEFCPTLVKKATVGVVEKSRFRVGGNAEKKFDAPGRPSSPLASEFRLGSSPRTSKSSGDVEGFMKFDKKLGNAKTATVDRDKKKGVSYLDLYRRKFASVERSSWPGTPKGSTSSICGDRSEERLANVGKPVPREDPTELEFYRWVMESRSRGSRENRSCEDLDRSSLDEGVSRKADDAPRCYSDSIGPVNSGKRVFYRPYTIEDYRSLSVPQADRSLGPDRIEIGFKSEWLMRRRSYGDSVSARNRQRILRREQKSKQSRRADAEKLPVHPLTDLHDPKPASKIVHAKVRSDETVRAEGPFRPVRRVVGKQTGDKKCKLKTVISSGVENFYKNPSDTLEDPIHLRTLRQRHLDEKTRIDLLLKR